MIGSLLQSIYSPLDSNKTFVLASGQHQYVSELLQESSMTMQRNVGRYGDDYYLAVFAEHRWAAEEITHQRFAVAVELELRAKLRG